MVDLGVLPPGGYGVELARDGELGAPRSTSADPPDRLRYGFVVDFRPGRDPAPVADQVRRLHLTGIQFYDWAYRHADLLGGGEDYADALGQPVSLDTVRALIAGGQLAGADALGYAAVYGVGNAEWPTWQHDALLPAGRRRRTDSATSCAWSTRRRRTGRSTSRRTSRRRCRPVGFDGFHLDQYGYPKWAVRPDGAVVDVAESFVTPDQVGPDRCPRQRWCSTTSTTSRPGVPPPRRRTPIYIEVWQPHDTLDALAAAVSGPAPSAPDRPVVVAAYQHVYDACPAEIADRSTASDHGDAVLARCDPAAGGGGRPDPGRPLLRAQPPRRSRPR